MKYYHEFWGEENGKGVWKREEITKETAIMILDHNYKDPCKLVNTPCYYRCLFDAVDVVDDREEHTS